MLLFIIACLAIIFFIQTNSHYLSWLTSPLSMYLGFAFIVFSALAVFIKRIKFALSYDTFAVGSLLIWFSYWQKLFKPDAPMFYFFPLYFALLTSIIIFSLVKRDETIDQASLDGMRAFEKLIKYHPFVIAATVLMSITQHGHFLLFPTTMTLLIMSYAFGSYMSKYP